MPQTSPFRPFRNIRRNSLENNESSDESERVPFLTQEQTFLKCPTLEDGAFGAAAAAADDAFKGPAVTCLETSPSFDALTSKSSPRWRCTDAIPSLRRLLDRRHSSVHKEHITEGSSSFRSLPTTPLRRVVRLLAFALMLLGVLEFIALTSGLFLSFFPDDVDNELDDLMGPGRMSGEELGHWPTDFSADIHPVACHSHNDYWRKEPLFSALEVGCTGVEADVWLYDQELYVGHRTSSLTPERTLRNLYINPLVKILDAQNPQTSFHPSLDIPRNGVFDTNPSQTLVLLIDFKNEGHRIWPYVVEQLGPLRERKMLSYYNGTSVVEGPITVIVTGNAPWDEVVANPTYRDLFFDAPLDLMGKLPDLAENSPDTQDGSLTKRVSNQGQGRSGAAPSDPAMYSPANSYYASVSFKRAVGWPWRGSLSRKQIETMRKQIAGAHARGLKVRYWSVPSWPRGMRNYLWRTLVKEGVDFLNVDDLKAATTGDWNWEKKRAGAAHALYNNDATSSDHALHYLTDHNDNVLTETYYFIIPPLGTFFLFLYTAIFLFGWLSPRHYLCEHYRIHTISVGLGPCAAKELCQQMMLIPCIKRAARTTFGVGQSRWAQVVAVTELVVMFAVWPLTYRRTQQDARTCAEWLSGT
ncbi:Altered inheritance of mitochondria protein 6 [Cladophialophora chaetospira]|uniref:Altered inheritance of mitochondria protein 6 n=1 Tax=Cladophialophora chaetospira TaxID=386627 RepID=A0AA38WXE2_9EURO|nr:Altered inheritance of mitochondria protein 6 [Cladophialophora chaetospira]